MAGTPLDWKGRAFITLLVRAVNFYSRHRETIDPVVTLVVREALEVLIDNLSSIEALNAPGPQ